LRTQQLPVLPATFCEHTESPLHAQSMVAPQPFGSFVPHMFAKPVLHVAAVQQVPPAPHTPLFGQLLVILPPQPSSNCPQATFAASGGSAGVHGLPHLPLLLHTWPVGQVPQLIVAPPQVLLSVPHSRPTASHSRGYSGGPQRFAMPSVAHDCPVGQLPQKMSPPQPSEM
jgi:hypothetical protein